MDSKTAAATCPFTSNAGELKYSRTIADLPGPKGQPIVGNMLQFDGRQAHLTIEKWIREFGPIFRFNVLGTTGVVVSDYTVVAKMLRERPTIFRRNEGGIKIMTELKIAGVFTSEGDAWRRQRKQVMRGLNAEVVRNFFPTMVAMTQRMMERWKTQLANGKPVDLHRDLKAMSLDVIVAIAMGRDINALNDDGNQLQRDIDNLFRRLGARGEAFYPYWRYFRLPVDRAADKSAARIEQTVAGIIQETRERMKQQPHLQQKPSNMLEAMIATSDDPDSDFTDQELIGNAITSVVGGEDTTANSIAWMINTLVHHPAALVSLTAEADAILGDDPFVQDWEKLNRFPYLEATHNESQRLKSVGPLFGFKTNVDTVIADTFIPKNTSILGSSIGAGMDEAHFPQSDLFRPERWIFDESPAEGDDPMRKLFPFGGGPRLCPGRFLALTEIKMVVSMLVHNFELEFDTKAPPVKQLLNFFMVPSAVPVRIKLRK